MEAGYCNEQIKICDTARWISILTIKNPFELPIYSLVILQNKYLTCAGENATIALCDYNTGKLKNTLFGHAIAIYSMI